MERLVNATCVCRSEPVYADCCLVSCTFHSGYPITACARLIVPGGAAPRLMTAVSITVGISSFTRPLSRLDLLLRSLKSRRIYKT